MECSEARLAIQQLLDGELPDPAARELNEHLARCGRCAAELEQLRRLRGLVQEAVHRRAAEIGRNELWARISRSLRVVPPSAEPREGAWYATPPGSARKVSWNSFGTRLTSLFPRLRVAAVVTGIVLAIVLGWALSRSGLNPFRGHTSPPPPSHALVELPPQSGATVLYFQTDDPHVHVVWLFYGEDGL